MQTTFWCACARGNLVVVAAFRECSLGTPYNPLRGEPKSNVWTYNNLANRSGTTFMGTVETMQVPPVVARDLVAILEY